MKQKQYKLFGVFFRNIKGENSSREANPRYSFEIVQRDGTAISGTTATNAGCAYAVENYEGYPNRIEREIDGEIWFRDVWTASRLADVTYHVTRAGNVIVDFINPTTVK